MREKNLIFIVIIALIVIAITLLYYLQNFQDEAISLNKEEFSQAETIIFSIKAKVKLCTNDIPYSIMDENGEPVKTRHSCMGLIGSGRDCYCKNGTIDCVSVGPGCSDAISCWEEKVDNTFSWNQLEYIEITDNCEGRTIRREEAQQVKPGRYKIVVSDSEKSFLIK